MKKTFISCAAMALALWACSDDSSSTAPDSLFADGESSSVSGELSSSGTVPESSGVASSPSKQSSSSAVPASSAKVESSSATVPVSSAKTESSSSAVPVSSEKVESSSSVVAVKSSSSVAVAKSSSSVKAPVSSSSVGDPSHLVLTDAVAQCSERSKVVVDPSLDGGDGALPPVAYRYVSTERTGFYIENITFTCDVTVDSLDITVSDETIYVKAKMNYANAKRCLCDTKLDFAVDNDSLYTHAKWIVFDDESSVNLQNKMRIVDMDVITVEEVMTHQTTKDIDVECKNDRQTLLPVTDTASTKKIYAARIDNGDGTETISINEISVGCGVKDVQFDVDAYSDTLYVKASAGLYATNCVCPSRVDFTIKKGLRFNDTRYLKFDEREVIPLVVVKQ